MQNIVMKKRANKQYPVQEDKPNRATEHHSSTTQGGSNFGQGSLQLGNKSIQQGSEKDEGANYNDEQGWNNEALSRKDIAKKRK